MFQLFQSYVAISVFMLQIENVLSECCICFTHMLQVYVLDVSSIFDVCCIQVFHVARVLCCSESQGAQGVMVAWHGHWVVGRGEPWGRRTWRAACWG